MANANDKQPSNVKGKYYVDTNCIDCDLCRQNAPNNFDRDNKGGYSYVYRQPRNSAELKQCADALRGCPVDAIGSNG